MNLILRLFILLYQEEIMVKTLKYKICLKNTSINLVSDFLPVNCCRNYKCFDISYKDDQLQLFNVLYLCCIGKECHLCTSWSPLILTSCCFIVVQFYCCITSIIEGWAPIIQWFWSDIWYCSTQLTRHWPGSQHCIIYILKG